MARREQDLPNLDRIVRARLSQAIPDRVSASTTPNLDRIREARRLAGESEDPDGFLERFGRFLGNVNPIAAPGARTPEQQIQQLLSTGAAALDPTIGAVEAVFQIPGLFTDTELPTDRAANYFRRAREGLLTVSEEAAIRSGIDPEAVGDIHLFGELIGYTAPIVASLKVSRLALGIKGGTDLTLLRDLKIDTVAGLVFGSTLLPEEELAQRVSNMAREAAVFGVGGLMIGGLLRSVVGMRRLRSTQKGRDAALAEEMERIARGGRVVLDGDDGIALVDLLSEEGFLASSPEAHALLEQFSFDNALIAGVRDLAESGLSRGFVREIGTDFTTVNRQLQAAREQFPNLKFDVVSRTIAETRPPLPGTRVFHGTGADFSGTPTVGDRPGLYLSQSRKVAETRAREAGAETSKIFEGRLNPRRTLDLDNPPDEFVEFMERQASERLGEPANLARDNFDFVEALTTTRAPRQPGDVVGNITEQEILGAARALGFDTVKFAERVGVPGSITHVALNQSAISFVTTPRSGKVFDLHFGLTGLNNQQKAQLAREGRYAGQLIQKNDTFYQYVRKGKGDRLVVRTVNGRTTSIKPDGVTDIPVASEEIPLPTTGEALYEDFRTFAFDKLRQAADASGNVDEVSLVRFLRQGQVELQGTRAFESPGAITHPAEVGRFPDGSKFRLEHNATGPDGALAFVIRGTDDEVAGQVFGSVDDQGVFNIIDMESVDESIGASGIQGLLGPGNIRDLGRQLIKFFGEQGIEIRGITGFRTSGTQAGRTQMLPAEFFLRNRGQTPQEFAARYLEEGAHGRGLLEPEPIRRFEDVFNAWLRERGLAPDAGDIEAFQATFRQRMQRDIWDLVPEEDAATLRRIPEETERLIDAEELPFEVLAGTRGFHVEREGAEVILRDINTGARLRLANEEVAERALRRVVRTEKDPTFEFIDPGPHGGSALTTGFDPSDGIFAAPGEINLPPDEISRLLPTQLATNRRDYFDAVERASGVPLFSQGFEPLDRALLNRSARANTFSRRIADIWKGIKRPRRKRAAEFWASIEGTDISGAALNRAGREAGLNSREIRAVVQSQNMYKHAAELMGLPESRFISNYYSRIRPEIEKTGRADWQRLLADDPIGLQEHRFWAEMTRTGELPRIELDPEVVMHKYFNALSHKLDVAPLENRFRQMVNLRIRDLTPAQRERVMRRALEDTTEESFVLPREVRDVAKEYMNNVRGFPAAGMGAARRTTMQLFEKIGIRADPQLFDELMNTYLTIQYGAALGLRTIAMNRNATQTTWMMYTRVGARHGDEAMRLALTNSGYDEAVAAGAIREVNVSVPLGDAIFEELGPVIAQGSGPMSNAVAAAMRKGIRAGRVTRKVAQKFLVPYGSGDQVQRAVAYHWQKLHTQELLQRFQAGRINWDDFVERGLPYFSDTIKQGFRQRYDRLGSEAALQYIGKQAADEAHFIYGSASTPTWMQKPFGRLAGVFGQWPLWAKQLYVNRMAHATPRQRAALVARTAALAGAFANIGIQTGISMWNWMAPLSLGYGGGPVIDAAIAARDVWTQPLDRKSAAMDRLMGEVGSLAFPGQLFYAEVEDALDQSSPAHAALRLTLGRNADEGNFNFDITLNPEVPGFQDTRGRLPFIEGLPPLAR